MARRVFKGVVVGDSLDKTVHVLVERRYMHPLYGKIVRKKRKFAAHDPLNTYRLGDRVSIIETRPYSKTKTWAVMSEEGTSGKQGAQNTSDVSAATKNAEGPSV